MTKQPTQNLLFQNLEEGFTDQEYLEILQKCVKAYGTNICAFVIDFRHNVYMCASAKTLEITYQKYYYNADMPLFDSIPKEERHEMMKRSDSTRTLVDNDIHPAEKSSLTIIEDYHIKMNGRNILITQKFTPLSVDNDGTITSGLLVMPPSVNSSFGELVVLCEECMWRYDKSTCSFVKKKKMSVSDSEKELLLFSTGGASVKEIAKFMCLTENTIKTKRKRLFKKLGVTNVIAAVTKMNNYSLW